MDISLKQLHYLTALADFRHFGKAADALGISQPALTRSIQNLERDLGVLLFDRNTHTGIEPTVYGKMILEKGEKLLAESQEILRELRLLQGLDHGELEISTGLFASEISVSPAVGRLIQAHPEIRCRIKITDWRQATQDVLERQVDLAVAESSEAQLHDELQIEPLGQHQLVFFTQPNHPLANKQNLSFEHLLDYPWIAPRGPKRLSEMFPPNMKKAGYFEPRSGDFIPAVLVNDLSCAKTTVKHSIGIGIAPDRLLSEEIRNGTLLPLTFTLPWLKLNYGFIFLKNRTLSPSAIEFMKATRAVENFK